MIKYIRVTMPDGSKWDVPAKIIADNRAQYYAEHDTGIKSGPEYEKVFKEEFDIAMKDDYDIEDWASNNMDWIDVAIHAKRVAERSEAVDMQEGWLNGEKEIVEY